MENLKNKVREFLTEKWSLREIFTKIHTSFREILLKFHTQEENFSLKKTPKLGAHPRWRNNGSAPPPMVLNSHCKDRSLLLSQHSNKAIGVFWRYIQNKNESLSGSKICHESKSYLVTRPAFLSWQKTLADNFYKTNSH